MSLSMVFAAALTVLSVAAGFVRFRQGLWLSATVSAIMGMIMLAVLFIPEFKSFEAAGLIFLLVIPMLVSALWSPRPPREMQRSVALTLLDIGFMALNLLFMPAKSGNSASVIQDLEQTHGAGGMHEIMPSASYMRALPLLGWACCIGIIIVPVVRRKGLSGLHYALCSGGMLAAMAVMGF